MTWIVEPDRYEVWAMLLSCGHIQWLIEWHTIDEAAEINDRQTICFQCRYRLAGRIRLPKRAVLALRPGFRTWREKNEAYHRGDIPRHLRWR